MSCKIIIVKPDSNDVTIKYCSRRNENLNGLRNSIHQYYVFKKGNESLRVETIKLNKLTHPYVKHYKQKKIGWFNIYHIFDYKILKSIAYNIESK